MKRNSFHSKNAITVNLSRQFGYLLCFIKALKKEIYEEFKATFPLNANNWVEFIAVHFVSYIIHFLNVCSTFTVESAWTSLNQKSAGTDTNVWNRFHEIIDSASVGVTTFDIVFLPFDVIDLAGYVSANDVIFFNLVQCQVRVIYSDEDNARVVRSVQKDSVVNFRHRNLPCCSIYI